METISSGRCLVCSHSRSYRYANVLKKKAEPEQITSATSSTTALGFPLQHSSESLELALPELADTGAWAVQGQRPVESEYGASHTSIHNAWNFNSAGFPSYTFLLPQNEDVTAWTSPIRV